MGLERKARSAQASWAETKLGLNLKHNLEIFQGRSSCALTSTTMTEDHVNSLFCCYSVCLITIKLNSHNDSEESDSDGHCRLACQDSGSLIRSGTSCLDSEAQLIMMPCHWQCDSEDHPESCPSGINMYIHV